MKLSTCVFLAITACTFACKKDTVRLPDDSYQPVILPANFSNSTQLTNPYFTFETGKKYIYEGQTEDGLERVEVQRLADTREVLGITCVIVNDKVWLNGMLVEDTDDWYAQDNDGNVWYIGEDVDNLNPDGSVRDHAGAWEAGVDGARAGLAMPANPQAGMSYRQEYYFNHAEDEAEILETGLTITTPYGNFADCLKTREWTDLEPDVNENKFYAPGVGIVKSVNVTDNEEVLLIDIQ
ncbi:MAG: hypothetical protein KDC65_09115 [Saprospiraceae bacterium]|nr:hypothetical protein [Saprospiraceae bacterium]